MYVFKDGETKFPSRICNDSFKKVECQNTIIQLPSVTDSKNESGKEYNILSWNPFSDDENSHIYLPIIDLDGKIIPYKKCYCKYCQNWFISKFKTYYIDQHVRKASHHNNIHIRNYQESNNGTKTSEQYSYMNIILFILLEGKPISTIESTYLKNICPQLHN